MGSPTVELYNASYNATHPTGRQLSVGVGKEGYYRTTDTAGTGNRDYVRTEDNEGIYGLVSNTQWCLASPLSRYAYKPYLMCSISCVDKREDNMEVTSTYNGLRPIVCLQKSNFNYDLKD